MKTISNSKITRWKALLEHDVARLKESLGAYQERTAGSFDKESYKLAGSYDLAPNTKEGIEKQIREDEDILKDLDEEINQMKFEFGFKGKVTESIPVEPRKDGLSIKP